MQAGSEFRQHAAEIGMVGLGGDKVADNFIAIVHDRH